MTGVEPLTKVYIRNGVSAHLTIRCASMGGAFKGVLPVVEGGILDVAARFSLCSFCSASLINDVVALRAIERVKRVKNRGDNG